MLGPVYLDGSYSEIYPDKSENIEGLQRFFKQFSFPGQIGSHCTGKKGPKPLSAREKGIFYHWKKR
jgi:phosphoketolase